MFFTENKKTVKINLSVDDCRAILSALDEKLSKIEVLPLDKHQKRLRRLINAFSDEVRETESEKEKRMTAWLGKLNIQTGGY